MRSRTRTSKRSHGPKSWWDVCDPFATGPTPNLDTPIADLNIANLDARSFAQTRLPHQRA
jgi:hypothetical protein